MLAIRHKTVHDEAVGERIIQPVGCPSPLTTPGLLGTEGGTGVAWCSASADPDEMALVPQQVVARGRQQHDLPGRWTPPDTITQGHGKPSWPERLSQQSHLFVPNQAALQA